MSKLLREAKTDETVSRTRSVFDGDKVRATYTIQHGPNGKGKTFVVEDGVFDFGGCSSEEVLLLATRAVVIATQSRARVAMNSNLNDALKADQWAVIDVKRDVVDTERKAATPVAKATNLIAKLSPEDRAALLKMLSA